MSDANQLSRGGAWGVGALFVAGGIPPVLIGIGVLKPPPSPDNAPAWLALCAGIAFIAAGLCVIVDYGIGGITLKPDGDFPDGTPIAIRVANLVLGAIIVGSMTAMFGWVSFGPGTRHFSTTIYLPFMPEPLRQRSGEISGRIIFGFGTILLAFMFVACTVVGIKRLQRARSN